jgi:hypothetical protein
MILSAGIVARLLSCAVRMSRAQRSLTLLGPVCLMAAFDRPQVRNSAGGIVQLAYGDDGLDPLRMEGASAGQPLDLGRLLTVGAGSRAGAAPLSRLKTGVVAGS